LKVNYKDLERPSVIVSSHKSSWPSCPNCGNEFSANDFSSWIESMNKTHIEICIKSLRCGIYRESAEVNYVVAPTLCSGSGWQYLDGSCYKKSDVCRKHEAAKAYCKQEGNSSLPIAKTESQNVLLEQLSGPHDTWLGMEGKWENNKMEWYWNDKTPLQYIRWRPGKPDGENQDEKCAVTIGGPQTGWDDMDCERCNFVICQKASPLLAEQTLNNSG